MKFKIITPEKVIYEAEIEKVSLPSTAGQITILKDHDDLISLLGAGEVLVTKEDGQTENITLAGGLVKVSQNQIEVLADTAGRGTEVNEELIKKIKQRAKELTKAKAIGEVDFAGFRAKLQSELAKIAAVKKRRRPSHLGKGPGRMEPEI